MSHTAVSRAFCFFPFPTHSSSDWRPGRQARRYRYAAYRWAPRVPGGRGRDSSSNQSGAGCAEKLTAIHMITSSGVVSDSFKPTSSASGQAAAARSNNFSRESFTSTKTRSRKRSSSHFANFRPPVTDSVNPNTAFRKVHFHDRYIDSTAAGPPIVERVLRYRLPSLRHQRNSLLPCSATAAMSGRLSPFRSAMMTWLARGQGVFEHVQDPLLPPALPGFSNQAICPRAYPSRWRPRRYLRLRPGPRRRPRRPVRRIRRPDVSSRYGSAPGSPGFSYHMILCPFGAWFPVPPFRPPSRHPGLRRHPCRRAGRVWGAPEGR